MSVDIHLLQTLMHPFLQSHFVIIVGFIKTVKDCYDKRGTFFVNVLSCS